MILGYASPPLEIFEKCLRLSQNKSELADRLTSQDPYIILVNYTLSEGHELNQNNWVEGNRLHL